MRLIKSRRFNCPNTLNYDFAVTSALVRLLLSMPGGGRRCLSQKERQRQLVDFLGTHGNYTLPDKLPDCSAITGQTLLAVAAANLTAQSPECQERLSNLLYRWYEGSEDQPGLRATLESQQTTTVLQQTIDALGHLLQGKMLSQTCRFGALCVAWMAIEDQIQANLKQGRHLVIRRYRSALSILEAFLKC